MHAKLHIHITRSARRDFVNLTKDEEILISSMFHMLVLHEWMNAPQFFSMTKP